MQKSWSRKDKTLIALAAAFLLCLIILIVAFFISFKALADHRRLGLAEEEQRLQLEKNERLQGQINRLKEDITENAGRLKTKEEQLADAERAKLEMQEQRRLRLEAEKRDQDLLKSAQKRVESLFSAGQGSVFLEGDALTVRLTNSVLFASGQASLSKQGAVVLDAVVQLLDTELKDLTIKVEGHTDNDPIGQVLKVKFATNWELSSARASAAVVYLVDKGINPQRLRAVGRADTAPVDTNDNEAGRANNRRIDFVVDLKSSLPVPSPATAAQVP
ncbi:MAG: OmpA family protein [Blastochloris sp.]|jgi:chemotaxis protein MotB|nr:OmpA family protein [Blastochloris sp.]